MKYYESLAHPNGRRDGLRVAHWTPGRVRLCFSDATEGQMFADSVRGVHGVHSAEFNPLTGSVLIRYSEGDRELHPILEARLSSQARAVAAPAQPRCPACRQAIRAERDALPNLVKLTGSVITGDVVGVVTTLISLSRDEFDLATLQ